MTAPIGPRHDFLIREDYTHKTPVDTDLDINGQSATTININDIIKSLKTGDKSALAMLDEAGVNYQLTERPNGYTVNVKYEGTNYRVTFIGAPPTPQINNEEILSALEAGDTSALEKLKSAGVKYELVQDNNGGYTVTYEYKNEKYSVSYTVETSRSENSAPTNQGESISTVWDEYSAFIDKNKPNVSLWEDIEGWKNYAEGGLEYIERLLQCDDINNPENARFKAEYENGKEFFEGVLADIKQLETDIKNGVESAPVIYAEYKNFANKNKPTGSIEEMPQDWKEYSNKCLEYLDRIFACDDIDDEKHQNGKSACIEQQAYHVEVLAKITELEITGSISSGDEVGGNDKINGGDEVGGNGEISGGNNPVPDTIQAADITVALQNGDIEALKTLKDAGIDYTYTPDSYGGFNVKFEMDGTLHSVTYAPEVENPPAKDLVYDLIKQIANGDTISIRVLEDYGIEIHESQNEYGQTVVSFNFEGKDYSVTANDSYGMGVPSNRGYHVDMTLISDRLASGDTSALSELENAGIHYDFTQGSQGFTVVIRNNYEVTIVEFPALHQNLTPERPAINHGRIKTALTGGNETGFKQLEDAGYSYTKTTNTDGGYTVKYTDDKGTIHTIIHKPSPEPDVSKEMVANVLQLIKHGNPQMGVDELKMLGIEATIIATGPNSTEVTFTYDGREYKVTSNNDYNDRYHTNNYTINNENIVSRLKMGDTSALSELEMAGIQADFKTDKEGFTVVYEYNHETVMVEYPSKAEITERESRTVTQNDINEVLTNLRNGDKSALQQLEDYGVNHRLTENADGSYKVEFDWQGKTLSVNYELPKPEPTIDKAEVHGFIKQIAKGDYYAIEQLRNAGIDCEITLDNKGHQVVSFEYDNREYKVTLSMNEAYAGGQYVNTDFVNQRLQHGDFTAISELERANIHYDISNRGPASTVIYQYQGEVFIIETEF